MKKIICTIMSLLLLLPILSSAQNNVIAVSDTECAINGESITLSELPFTYLSNIFLPVDDILPKIGFSLGWDSNINALVCANANNTYYITPNSKTVSYNGGTADFEMPATIKNGVMCISAQMISFIGGYDIQGGTSHEYTCLELFGDENCKVNTIPCVMSGAPFIYLSNIFIPVDDILPKLGFSMGWDDNLKAIVCTKNDVTSYVLMNRANMWVGNTNYEFDLPPMIKNGVTYISAAMLDKLAGCDIKISGTISEYIRRDTLQNTFVTDAYRLKGNSVAKGGGVTAVDGFGMEIVAISDAEARNYAEIINTAAENIPGVNVYNIVVPTAAEFYAPKNMYPNQLSGMKTLYGALSDKVIPVNIYDTLQDHAAEKIYFGTDHHWTQRGAYYAYKEFIEIAGGEIAPLESFENVPSYGYVGSLAGFAKGTAVESIMRNNPDMLERFMPKYASVGTVYADRSLKKKMGEVKAVNTNVNSYSCFIGGDGPVTVFHTNAPSDKTIVIVKESFGNAFAVWAMNNYKSVYVIDPRRFNGFGGNNEQMDLKAFCADVGCTDLVFINYPVAISSSGIRNAIFNMVK